MRKPPQQPQTSEDSERLAAALDAPVEVKSKPPRLNVEAILEAAEPSRLRPMTKGRRVE